MSELRELYQQVIIDHGRKPRNFGVLVEANYIKEGFNPLCGDRLTLYIHSTNEVIDQIMFTGCGCAISMASASLMTESMKGKTMLEAQQLFEHFHDMLIGKSVMSSAKIGKLNVLSGVSEFPARVKCATLAWHTLKAALNRTSEPVTTE